MKCESMISTKNFYSDILGFNVVDSAGNTLTVEKEGGRLIFTEHDLWNVGSGISGTVYFAIQNVNDYFNSIKDKSVVIWPLENTPYGSREFGVKDVNGYYLAFAQRN